MADDDVDPPPPRPTPMIVWAALAVLVVAAFVVALRVLNPVEPGIGGAQPQVITPGEPKATPLLDAKPATPGASS